MALVGIFVGVSGDAFPFGSPWFWHSSALPQLTADGVDLAKLVSLRWLFERQKPWLWMMAEDLMGTAVLCTH